MRWLDLGALSEENKKLKNMLYDEVTKLPTVSLILTSIRSLLKTHKQIGVIYVYLDVESRFEQTFGRNMLDGVMNEVGAALSHMRGSVIRSKDAISTVVKSGNDFVVLLAPPREKPHLDLDDLFEIRKRILKELRQVLNKSREKELVKRLQFHAGAAIIEDEPNIKVERLVYNALEAAKENAEQKELEKKQMEIDILRLAVEQREIITVFQPIVEFSSLQPLGYEALSRGPSPEIEHPEKMFRLAMEGDLVWKLDRCCRDSALLNAKGLPADFLFINIDPHAIGDPDFKALADSLYLKSSELELNRVVFDLSAHAVLPDFDLFKLTVQYFKSLGYKISLDDSGGGHYTGLEIIARSKPDFVKIDIPLVRDIEKDDVHQDLVSTIVRFADKAGSIVIAEGVETEAELKMLIKLGVDIGQGFLFAKPGKAFPKVSSR